MTDENKLITDNRVTSPVQNDQAKQHYIQRDDKLYLRVTLFLYGRSGDVCSALFCTADPAVVVRRFFGITGAGQFVPFSGDRIHGRRAADHRPAVRCGRT